MDATFFETVPSSKPIWLLDIDGVLNALARKPDPQVWPKGVWVTQAVENRTGIYTITISQSVIDFINEIDNARLVDIVWHTTWQAEANNVANLFGLNRFPIWPAPEYGESLGYRTDLSWSWWKAPGFQRALDTRRPVIWTDDDISLVDQRKFAGQKQALVIAPNSALGLAPKHLRAISGYIDRHVGLYKVPDQGPEGA